MKLETKGFNMTISGINPTLLKPKSINYPTRNVVNPKVIIDAGNEILREQGVNVQSATSTAKKLPAGKIAVGAIAVAGAILAALKIKQNADNKKENA